MGENSAKRVRAEALEILTGMTEPIREAGPLKTTM